MSSAVGFYRSLFSTGDRDSKSNVVNGLSRGKAAEEAVKSVSLSPLQSLEEDYMIAPPGLRVATVCSETVDIEENESPSSVYEPGQLMWEISAHKERTSDQEPRLFPELVLTDSSFLSTAMIHENVNPDESDGMKKMSMDQTEDQQDERQPQQCFELLTDENGPVFAPSDDKDFVNPLPQDNQSENSDHRGIESLDYETVKYLKTQTQLYLEKSGACKDQEKRIGFSETQTMQQSSPEEEEEEALEEDEEIKKIKSISIPACSPFQEDSCCSSIPKIETPDTDLLSRRSNLINDQRFDHHQMLKKVSVQVQLELNNIEESKQQMQSTTEDSSHCHTPRCSVTGVFTNTMSKVSRVFYHCFHRKQSKKEKELMKKMRENCHRTQINPVFSPCGSYHQRRNDLMRQRIEGMMNGSERPNNNKIDKKSLYLDLRQVHKSAPGTTGCLPSSGRLSFSARRRKNKISNRVKSEALGIRTGHITAATSRVLDKQSLKDCSAMTGIANRRNG